MESMESDSAASLRQRVKFCESDLDSAAHDADIVALKVKDSLYSVHLGFLQLGRRYEVKFNFDCGSVEGPLVTRTHDTPNLNLRVTELSPVNDLANTGHIYSVTLELFAHKEKVWCEQVHFESCANPMHHLSFILDARVLGRGKGTPFLKNGVRCIGVEMEEDSELSDWQGFD